MNYSIIRYIICRVLEFQAVFLALPCIVAVIYKEPVGWSFAAVMAGCFLVGWLGKKAKPKSHVFFAREGFVVVSLSWIVLSLTGALPFWISGEIRSFTDALFETISGLTTTGSSILSDVESLSRCTLFWRSFTHWIGGMGVLVLILAILPLAGGYNMHLMRAESPGPSVGKLVPRVRHTARILYGIYMAMTALLIVLLIISGMSFFEATTLAFGTAGTGGFGVLNSSIASYNMASQILITIFMILFGINFNVFYLLLIRKAKDAFKFEELRYYLLIIAVAIGLITWNIHGMFENIWEALHQASFQVASIITTTGYATADFGLWPVFSQTILVVLMFIGACAGSTGGGIKVSRIVILFKLVKNEISHMMHPKRVNQVRFGGHVVSKEIWRGIQMFLFSYIVIFFVSMMAISLCNLDFTTNFTAVAATLNNIGPGLNLVGPTGNFGVFSNPAKWVLMFDMLAGRLEIFPMLILLASPIWKRG